MKASIATQLFEPTLDDALRLPPILRQNSITANISKSPNRRYSEFPKTKYEESDAKHQRHSIAVDGIKEIRVRLLKQTQAEKQRQRPGARERRYTTTQSPLEAEQANIQTEGRKHLLIQTEPFLEPLPIFLPKSTNSTQTDEFLPRPPSPLFVPKSSGVDVETQIMPGELFDFDVEVQPIVEVLLGKVMEQSWIELIEEGELEMLRKKQKHYEAIRAAEKAEVIRLEQAEIRRQQEKTKLFEQIKRISEQKHLIQAKLVADEEKIKRAEEQERIQLSLSADKRRQMEASEIARKEVNNVFLPALTSKVFDLVELRRVAREILNEMIFELV